MTNAEIMYSCHVGIGALKARQKEIVKEHTERIKGLQHVLDSVCHRKQVGELQLGDDGAASLKPELVELLEDPLHGL